MEKAKILADLIKGAGYSRRAFAEKIGLPATTLQSMLTRGVGRASIDNVLKVCKGLGITTDQLEKMTPIGYEIGGAIKEERESQGLTAADLGESIGLNEQDILQFEDDAPISLDIAEKIASQFGLTFLSFLARHGLYDEYVPPHFNGDVEAYEKYKAAVDKDAENELTDEQILTLAAHSVGHEGPLSERDIEQIKMALRIALAKDNK